MLSRTHFAIGVFAALFFLDHVTFRVPFVITVIIASLLPDIDSGFSLLGKSWVARPLQVFTRHRGILHSFTFCILASGFLALYFPIYALPFFLGYGMHLLADSFTIDGIQPFWPFKARSAGILRVGSPVEHALFAGFCLIDIVLFISLFL